MEWYKVSLTKKQLKGLNRVELKIEKVQLLKRVQCIKLKNEWWKNSKLASFFWVCIDTITNWIKAYLSWWIKSLLEWNYKGKSSQLTKEHQALLKKRHNKQPFDTAKEARDYIENNFNLSFHLHWVQKLLKKNFDFHTKK